MQALGVGSVYKTVRREDITVQELEQRITGKRWCAYHRRFHDLDGFGAEQRLALWCVRYCKDFSNGGKRLKVLINNVNNDIPDDQLAYAARLLKWIQSCR